MSKAGEIADYLDREAVKLQGVIEMLDRTGDVFVSEPLAMLKAMEQRLRIAAHQARQIEPSATSGPTREDMARQLVEDAAYSPIAVRGIAEAAFGELLAAARPHCSSVNFNFTFRREGHPEHDG